jgi:hypothetical protein
MNKINELNIEYDSTLIIIDWDDTLFPTTWHKSKDIDLTCPNSRYKNLSYFKNLDDNLNKLIKKIKTHGHVVIITNASPEWIKLTLSILPKTKNILKNVQIVSARKRYQKKLNEREWKMRTFNDIIDEKIKKFKYTNILSLGDSKYEHYALINLFNHDKLKHKYLKSIKFIKSADYDIIIDQINIINDNIKNICESKRHMDLDFDLK